MSQLPPGPPAGPPAGPPGPPAGPPSGPPGGPPYGPPGGFPVPGGGGLYPDPQTGVLVPQGTLVASRGRRIGAYFLAIPLYIVTLGIGYVIWGLVVWPRGTSPALQVLGMRCWVIDDRRPAGFWRMVLRDVVGGIAQGILGPITALVSFVLFLATDRRQSLQDLVGGTVVLHDPNKVIG